MSFSFINKMKTNLYKKFYKDKYKKAPSLSELEKLTIDEVENARSNFKNCDEDTIDLAIYELMAAEERLNLLIKERKKKQ
ncbi:MAG: hypothetical protein RIN55_08530 [Tissierellaceae bacterium]|nr:hypothetical protein [Tissierellaceae bacterium]